MIQLYCMQYNMYVSSVGMLAYENMLSSLKNRPDGYEYIIITPDRFNFNIENLVFDILGEDSLFDVNVMTLSRFVYKCLGSSGVRVLSMQGACSIVERLLIENVDQCVSFGKSYKYKGFSKTLFETIAMFKSCHISPLDIKDDVSSVALANKLHDIKLIYQKYEEFLQGDYTDSFNRLNYLQTAIGDNVNKTNFYFVGFDDFTIQQYGVIQALIKHAASVNIATTHGVASNKKVYLNNIYYNTMDICKQLGITPNIVTVETFSAPDKRFLAENAYGVGGKYSGNKYLQTIKFDNANDEIEYVLKDILNKVYNGAKWEDFAILVPSFDEYGDSIERCAGLLGMPIFIDKSQHLCDISSFQFISQFIDLPINN